MSEQPKKRGLFQIHLSTAVALMFVAGAVLGVNLVVRTYYFQGEGDLGVCDVYCGPAYGWPWTCCRGIPATLWGRGNYNEKGVIPETIVHTDSAQVLPTPEKLECDLGAAFLDVLVALMAISACAGLCEWPIRRRERRP
ncbi:MAG TPA: hypothetical protein VGP72_09390 [Planctomycetota bacterium]|jgi:hypothetical protein